MDIYRKSRTKINYRKIWSDHFGPIPKDEQGRSYEIHHKDGNCHNNDIDNLQCVSLQEHYDIHKSQDDFYACFKLAVKLRLSKQEITDLASEAAKKSNTTRLENKTHHFLQENGWGEIPRKTQLERIEKGIHIFLDKEAARERAIKRVIDGTNPFLGGEIQGISSRKRVKDGSHNFVSNNPHNNKLKCPHCGKIVGLPLYNRWHGDKCKLNPTLTNP